MRPSTGRMRNYRSCRDERGICAVILPREVTSTTTTGPVRLTPVLGPQNNQHRVNTWQAIGRIMTSVSPDANNRHSGQDPLTHGARTLGCRERGSGAGAHA
jgi:hypothetical protein